MAEGKQHAIGIGITKMTAAEMYCAFPNKKASNRKNPKQEVDKQRNRRGDDTLSVRRDVELLVRQRSQAACLTTLHTKNKTLTE